MVQANTSDTMTTRLEDILKTNSASTWMVEVEQDGDTIRQQLQAKLAQVPQQAARVSGPRDDRDVSYAIWQKIKNKVGVDFEEPLSVSFWKENLDNVEREFNPLSMCTDTQSQDDMCLFDKKIREKNRYSDILAYKHSRVNLVPRASMPHGDTFVNGYINANFVDGPLNVGDRKIIAAQGPLENTYMDLWRMVSQENVTLIVTTCNVVEKRTPKCHQFWPPVHTNIQAEFDEGLSNVGITVQPSGETIQITEHLFLRKFTMTDSDLGITSREIRQLHYTGWPDHGVPSNASAMSFMKMFEIFTYMLLASEPSEKAIVHCSAGIGRTGTTIGLAHLIT